ncbi:hypothetical protein K469DRAFT_496510, partial [Zopfia rhizophila CBS 207.26]
PCRLLCVGDREVKLVETNSSSAYEYVALAHQRRNNYIKYTSCDNITSWYYNIAMDTLPFMYQDAINATRQLGFKYPWIDSLYIIQDDSDD